MSAAHGVELTHPTHTGPTRRANRRPKPALQRKERKNNGAQCVAPHPHPPVSNVSAQTASSSSALPLASRRSSVSASRTASSACHRAGDARAGLHMQALRASVGNRRDRDARTPLDPSATTMTIGSKSKHQQVLPLVHRKPVRSGLVLSNAGLNSAASAGCSSQHRDGCGRCSAIRPAALEFIDTSPDAPHQRDRSVESP